MKSNDDSISINKFISDTGICSRREADVLIKEGRVSINGQRASLGNRVHRGDKVKVSGKLLKPKPRRVYIALNKPKGIVSTTDNKEPKNIVKFVGYKSRLFPIGRLDKDSEGLILLTNDGDIVNKILRAGNEHQKEYIVTVDKPFEDEFLEKMSNGVPILGQVTKKCKVSRINENTFKIILIQGLNRQIRRMCEYFGYEVTRLIRVRIMNIKLGKLKTGEWRILSDHEVNEMMTLVSDSKKTSEEKPRQKSFNIRRKK